MIYIIESVSLYLFMQKLRMDHVRNVELSSERSAHFLCYLREKNCPFHFLSWIREHLSQPYMNRNVVGSAGSGKKCDPCMGRLI